MTQAETNHLIRFLSRNDTSVQVLAKLEGPLADGSEIVDVEVEKQVIGAGWQTLSFNFASDRRNSYPYGVGHPQEQGWLLWIHTKN